MNTSFRFRLYPNKEQEELIKKTFGCVRFIYNRMLTDSENYFNETGRHLKTSPARYKDQFPFLKEVDSCALNWAEKALNAAYKNHFLSSAEMPKKKNIRHNSRLSYTTSRTRGNILIKDGYLKLPKIGMVKVVQHRDIPNNYDLKSVTVSRTPSGKYFASILFDYENIVEFIESDSTEESRYIGLDYSIGNLFVTSDGIKADFEKTETQLKEKLSKAYRKLVKCEMGSNNHEKQRLAVAKIYEKIANRRKDNLHKISRKMVKDNDCICVEDLNLKNMAHTFNHSSKVKEGAYGQFLKNIEYKLQREGKHFIKISKWFPSSKTCSACGSIKTELLLSERTYHCECCGAVLDRDINAAINIRMVGERLHKLQ